MLTGKIFYKKVKSLYFLTYLLFYSRHSYKPFDKKFNSNFLPFNILKNFTYLAKKGGVVYRNDSNYNTKDSILLYNNINEYLNASKSKIRKEKD